jgi:hypothetical protein
MTYPVAVILLQYPTSTLVDFLVGLITPTHSKRGVHVDVVARKIQADESLEDDAPSGESASEENEQAGRSAAISDHIQYSAKLSRLVEFARCIPIERIKQAREGVEERAGAWVQWHVV